MRKCITAVLFGLLCITATICAYNKGRDDVWISEFKLYDANLIKIQHFETNIPPELKEYMKGRYYYLANKIPNNWLGNPYDYGEVNSNVIHLVIGKGDIGPRYEYEIFKQKKVTFKDP
jgi:hypothetical protein